MASFVPPEGAGSPFGSGGPFEDPFATTSASPSEISSGYPISSSSSTPSSGSTPSLATDPSDPDYSSAPGTASSSQNPVTGSQLRNPLLAAFVIAAVLGLSAIAFIFVLRRRARKANAAYLAASAQPPLPPQQASGADRAPWDVDPEAAAAIMADAQAQYQRHLRDEGLNELGEAPPPYKKAESLYRAAPTPYSELPAATEGFELATLSGGPETRPGTGTPPAPPSSPVLGDFPDTIHHPRPPPPAVVRRD